MCCGFELEVSCPRTMWLWCVEYGVGGWRFCTGMEAFLAQFELGFGFRCKENWKGLGGN